jgi:hypothetical protein
MGFHSINLLKISEILKMSGRSGSCGSSQPHNCTCMAWSPVKGLVFFGGDTKENCHNAKLKFSTPPLMHYQFWLNIKCDSVQLQTIIAVYYWFSRVSMVVIVNKLMAGFIYTQVHPGRPHLHISTSVTEQCYWMVMNREGKLPYGWSSYNMLTE